MTVLSPLCSFNKGHEGLHSPPQGLSQQVSPRQGIHHASSIYLGHDHLRTAKSMQLDEIRKQELRGEVSNENKDERYPEPYQHFRDWEEGAANLPVAYYDNDDGFWDPIISEKLRRYDAHKPMLKTRKHFTH